MQSFDKLLEKYSHKTNTIIPPAHKVEDVKIPAHSPITSENIENPENLKNKFVMYHKKPEKSIEEIMDMLEQFEKKTNTLENELNEDIPTVKPPKKAQNLLDSGNNTTSLQEGSSMSTKIDTLLKRATSFERLALYIDQKSFLQAIAQVQQFPPESNLGINAPFVDETTPSVQNETTQSGGTNNYEENNQSDILQVPEQTIVGYTPIPRDVQSMLNHIMTSEGGKPITIDGELGPETRKALNAFKASFNVPSNFLDNEVYDVIRNIYSRSTKK